MNIVIVYMANPVFPHPSLNAELSNAFPTIEKAIEEAKEMLEEYYATNPDSMPEEFFLIDTFTGILERYQVSPKVEMNITKDSSIPRY